MIAETFIISATSVTYVTLHKIPPHSEKSCETQRDSVFHDFRDSRDFREIARDAIRIHEIILAYVGLGQIMWESKTL